MSRANSSIPSNMSESFEQGTDRAFANFLTHSKGSLAELLTRLKHAHAKNYITADELNERQVSTSVQLEGPRRANPESLIPNRIFRSVIRD
jgi:four helix bundle protein